MINKNLVLMALAVFAAGCGIETRTFVMTKPRIGLEAGNGNAGCVVGKCPAAPAPKETTRKIYVLEITKPVPESEVRRIEEKAVNVITENVEAPPAALPPSASSTAAAGAAAQSPAASQTIPVVGELPGTMAAPAVAQAAPAAAPAGSNAGNLQAQTYTVQKDDTLQKISKKVFGSYGKWYKIYEANKDKIKNPNVLKPGTVLTIPSIK